jgi:hypothetical protein
LPWPAPPVRYDGLLATAGRPEPVPPPAAAAPPFVAIAVGKTKEGASLPANPRSVSHPEAGAKAFVAKDVPSLEKPVPLCMISARYAEILGRTYLSMTTAGV